MATIPEKIILDSPSMLSYECTEKILNQMKECVCKIFFGDTLGTGFICKIPFPDRENMKMVLITNNHIIDNTLFNKEIELIFEKRNISIKINLNISKRMKYTNKTYDITIIDIKEEEEEDINDWLELDDSVIENIILNENKNDKYKGKTIYIMQYPQNELKVSYGLLKDIYDNKNNFNHTCSTLKGSSGSPITLGENNKVIGIHCGEEEKRNLNTGSFLNLAINEFIKKFGPNSPDENEILQIKFNENYKTAIKDSHVEEINFDNKIIKDSGLKDLSRIRFDKLKILNLKENNIKRINCLKNFNCETLENLNLSGNKISNINILDKVNFPELKELDLNNNEISDINPLKTVKFGKLEKLILNRNKISDINSLEKANFPELKELNLGSNEIKDITVLQKVNFAQLEKLLLSNNKISEIIVLKNVNFKKLEDLNLYQNNISDINVFKDANFKELKKLRLGKNNIKDIKVLNDVKFDKIKILDLEYNKINNIKIFENVDFKNLEILKLGSNEITDINILKNVNFKENIKELYLAYNKIKDINVFNDIGKFKNLVKLTLVGNDIKGKDNNLIIIKKLKSRLKDGFAY